MSDDALETPELVRTRPVFDGGLIRVRVDTLRAEDGRTYEREVVAYGQAVVLVPVSDDGRLLFVRQYRHAAGVWLLELPAGGIDDGDASPDAAALRELREETGYRGTLTRLGGFFLAPGYSDEYQYIFAAHALAEDALEPDEDEDLRPARLTLEEALAAVASGEIRDAKSIAALLLYIRRREARPN